MMAGRKDLVVLAADKNAEFAIRGMLLKRSRALRIREPDFDLFVHPQNDPGCLLQAHTFLRPFCLRYQYALVLLDLHGCGQEENKSRVELESQIEAHLKQSGWEGRAAAVVIEPELENWVWSQSSHVEQKLGWQDRKPKLREWLVEQGLLVENEAKPRDPKRAVEEALRVAKKARSSDLYRELSSSVSFEGCTDLAFLKFKETLRLWFAQD